MRGTIAQLDHMVGGLKRQRVRRESWPWRNISRHLARDDELAIRSVREQGDHEVFERNDPDAKVHHFGIGQLGNVNIGVQLRMRQCPSFVFPSR